MNWDSRTVHVLEEVFLSIAMKGSQLIMPGLDVLEDVAERLLNSMTIQVNLTL
jgi:hypothetical protein